MAIVKYSDGNVKKVFTPQSDGELSDLLSIKPIEKEAEVSDETKDKPDIAKPKWAK